MTFFPSELLSITSVDHNDSCVHIKMRSKTHSSKCPECGHETATYHGTYLRKVQDLPILGKSTQAGLWERYRGAKIVNGDRALLRKINGSWAACGWPVCGSSDICLLGDTPIHAIIMLYMTKISAMRSMMTPDQKRGAL